MFVVKPLQFNPFEFERASEASYYDEAGLLVWAAADIPRYGFNPVTHESIGLIMEGSATNQLIRSNDFLNAAWQMYSPPVTAAAGVSPSGAADAFLYDRSPGVTELQQDVAILPSINSAIVFSLYAKQSGSPSTMSLTIPGATGYFSLTDGIAYVSSGATMSAFITDVGNGWYRCELARRTTSPPITVAVTIGSFSGDFLFYGAQVETTNSAAGYRASSYIRTTTTAETRAADVQQSQSPSLISTNVPEDDAPIWGSGTPYTEGTEVMVLGQYHRVYKATALAGNTDKLPPDNPTYWIDTGATNRWRMLDMKVGADNQTVHDGDINYQFALAERVDTICAFNLKGKSITATMYAVGETYYTQEISLIRPISRSSWYAYYFERRKRIKDVTFFDLPPANPSTIEITVTSPSGESESAVGKLIIGSGSYIGFAEYGTTSIGITSFSTKERDDFGNYFIQPRRYVGKMSVRPVIDSGNETLVRDILAECLDISSAYIIEAKNDEKIMLLGFYSDFDILFSTPAGSYCSIELEGI